MDTVTAAGGSAAVGNWVYLPWEAKIAHLLDGDSYFEVITDRNASEARYAAGQIGHVARRLLLSERVLPFVGNLDLAEFLPAAPRP